MVGAVGRRIAGSHVASDILGIGKGSGGGGADCRDAVRLPGRGGSGSARGFSKHGNAASLCGQRAESCRGGGNAVVDPGGDGSGAMAVGLDDLAGRFHLLFGHRDASECGSSVCHDLGPLRGMGDWASDGCG